jgi:hypothetical protein
MIDAIREILGLAPLYRVARPSAVQSRRWALSGLDGRTPVRGSRS